MKTGKSLVELAQAIQHQAEAKRDFIAPTGKIALFRPNDAAVGLALGDDIAVGGNVVNLRGDRFAINPLAHAQLAEYTGVPKTYYDRMLAEAPGLLVSNANHWLAQAGEKRMVRTLDGSVRALLSDRYRPLENSALAEAVLPVLLEQDLFIASCEITDRRLYIKAFDKRIEREIKLKGSDPAHTFLRDVVFPAITISNSEVGCGALSVAAGVYTGGCTNYAAFSDSRMKKYHVGGKAIDSEAVYALLSDETKRLTDAAIWAQTRDVVRSAFEIARFEELVGRLQDTTEQKIDGDVVKVIDVTAERFGFTKSEGNSILKHLINGGDLSRYGLFNAVTRAAADIEDYERATDFERAGGKIVELPKNDWERIAKAA